MINQKLNIELPTIRKDIVLMSPGIWNGFEYSVEDIKRAFERTDWKKASNLFLDHPENPNNAASSWAGRIINQKYIAGEIIGDLEMWDMDTIIKTELAKASFGVSPRVIGEEVGNKFRNFTFDNFSIVSKQAIDPSYINLNKTSVKSELLVKELDKEEKIEEKLNEQPEEIKIEIKEEIKSEENQEEKKEIEEKDIQEKMKGGNKMSETNQEIVSATQNEKKELSFEELSIEELNAILEKVQNVISSKTPKVQEMAKQDLALKEELESMRKTIQELNAKLNKPAPKTTRASGNDIRASLTPQTHSEGVREMASILVNNFG